MYITSTLFFFTSFFQLYPLVQVTSVVWLQKHAYVALQVRGCTGEAGGQQQRVDGVLVDHQAASLRSGVVPLVILLLNVLAIAETARLDQQKQLTCCVRPEA